MDSQQWYETVAMEEQYNEEENQRIDNSDDLRDLWVEYIAYRSNSLYVASNTGSRDDRSFS